VGKPRSLDLAACVLAFAVGCHVDSNAITPPVDGALEDSGGPIDGGTRRDGDVRRDTGVPVDSGPPPADGGPDAGPDRTLSIGEAHACATVDGQLYCWGQNGNGQLGLGDRTPRDVAAAVSIGGAVVELSAGELFTCAIVADEAMYCWGRNANGQLGAGDRVDRDVPMRLDDPSGFFGLSCGYSHACALHGAGELWCWGLNSEGQLAQSGSTDVLVPTQSDTFDDWVQIDAGQGHTCGVRATGALWCWGRNSSGELGQGTGASLQIRDPVRVGTSTDWVEVSADQHHTCGLRTSGAVFCWGLGSDPRLGQPDLGNHPDPVRVPSLDGITDIDAGRFHTCARQDEELYCWGRNIEGQLGLGNTDMLMGAQHTGAGFAAIDLGGFFTCALDTAGMPHCTGANSVGQLGVGDTVRRDRLTPVVLP
jgi:alpha-tubulin suppressor-like RCC1 family protein